jgi:putative aldouronate transport system substrate-binding protein
MFSLPSNASGLQQGWWANVLEEEIGVKLDIIATGDQGEQKYQALLAGGEFPDIVVFRSIKEAEDAVKAGMLLNLDEHKDKLPNVYKNADKAIKYYSDTISQGQGVYAVPNGIGPGEVGDNSTYGPYIRWDLYKKLGMPKLKTMEDYLPLLKQMQDLEPKTADGQKVYGFSAWKDWDGHQIFWGSYPNLFTGKDVGDQIGGLPFLHVDLVTGETMSTLDPNSGYIRGLKFFFTANQMGLLDPDSLTQRFDSATAKMQEGRTLASFWGWFANNYNTPDRMNAEQPTAMWPILTDESKLFWWGDNPVGNTWAMAIGKNTKNLDAALRYLDYMYSIDGLQTLMNGPKGVTWDIDAEGKPFLTDLGKDIIDNNKELPGGGGVSAGVNTVNSYGLSLAFINPETNQPLANRYWDSNKGRNPSKFLKEWQETTGYKSSSEMLKAENKFVLTPLWMKFIPPMPDDINTLRTQIGDVVKNHSWLAVFAKNEAEFNKQIDEMRKKAEGLGIQKVVDWSQQGLQQAKDKASLYE